MQNRPQHPRPLVRRLGAAAVAALVIAVPACGDDDATGADDATAVSQVRDRVRDATEACEDQDRDRLRDMTRDQDRDRLRDAAFAYAEDAGFDVLGEEVDVEGDEATVQVRVRLRNGEEADLEWHFRFEDGDWVLDGLPPCLTDGESPTTARDQDQDQDRDQDRDQDQDRSTTSQP